MYDRLKSLYLAGRLTDAGLDNAVTKGWITQAQAAEIRAAKAQQDADEAIVNGLVVDALSA